jgi:hypothetical protein
MYEQPEPYCLLDLFIIFISLVLDLSDSVLNRSLYILLFTSACFIDLMPTYVYTK